jgi:hypothetical protein
VITLVVQTVIALSSSWAPLFVTADERGDYPEEKVGVGGADDSEEAECKSATAPSASSKRR